MDFQYNLISRNGILFIGYDVENLCIDFKGWGVEVDKVETGHSIF
jgi:hypothetical protein